MVNVKVAAQSMYLTIQINETHLRGQTTQADITHYNYLYRCCLLARNRTSASKTPGILVHRLAPDTLEHRTSELRRL